MIAGAAVAGLLGGAFAGQARANAGSSQTSVSNAGSQAISLADDSSMGKHDCKGKNDCKGQGGCKSSANGCKGKNDCKGQGGCNTNKPASS